MGVQTKSKIKDSGKKVRSLRRYNLARSILHAWSSLSTHLTDATTAKDRDKRGNEEWNSRCVREYAEIIFTLAVELHELAKLDFKETHTELGVKIKKV